jgi:hypothetical protein
MDEITVEDYFKFGQDIWWEFCFLVDMEYQKIDKYIENDLISASFCSDKKKYCEINNG